MHGLVTLLPDPFYEQVEAIWDRLEQRCGLNGIRVTPYPHFSWNIAEHYDFERLEDLVRQLSTDIAPFPASTAGLGLFTGENPVVYMVVVRNEALSGLHKQLWQTVAGACDDLSLLYAPEVWVPHISLAYEDVDRENLRQAMSELAFETYNWRFVVDHIAFIRESEGQVGELKWKIPLGR